MWNLSFKMHSHKRLSFPFVAFGFSSLLHLLHLLRLSQKIPDRPRSRFFIQQVGNIPLAVMHHHRIIFLPVGSFYPVSGRTLPVWTNIQPCVLQFYGIHICDLRIQFRILFHRIFQLSSIFHLLFIQLF